MSECNFEVLRFDRQAWDGTTNYMFLRNNAPDPLKLSERLQPSAGKKRSAKIIEELYSSGEEVDLWVGCISEPHVRGAMVGKLLKRILVEQFKR